jgi:hypothetical protein
LVCRDAKLESRELSKKLDLKSEEVTGGMIRNLIICKLSSPNIIRVTKSRRRTAVEYVLRRLLLLLWLYSSLLGLGRFSVS